MPSKKLEITYYNGQPDGIRSIRKQTVLYQPKHLSPEILSTGCRKSHDGRDNYNVNKHTALRTFYYAIKTFLRPY